VSGGEDLDPGEKNVKQTAKQRRTKEKVGQSQKTQREKAGGRSMYINWGFIE